MIGLLLQVSRDTNPDDDTIIQTVTSFLRYGGEDFVGAVPRSKQTAYKVSTGASVYDDCCFFVAFCVCRSIDPSIDRRPVP